MQICEQGAVNLQAVSDYIDALKKIQNLEEDAAETRKKIIEKAKKGRYPKYLTDGEAEKERLHQIARQNSVLSEIERFFHSEWYALLCGIDGDYMIAKAKEKFESQITEGANCNIAKVE